MLPPIDRDERRWVYLVTVLVILLTTVPYFLGFAAESEGWKFSGFLFGVTDGNSYLAKMLRGYAGEWFFETSYTAIEQEGVIAYLPYMMLGKLTSPPAQHLQLIILYHGFRIAGLIFLVRIYEGFLTRYLKDKAIKRWALILVLLGGGVGWFPLIIGRPDWLEWLPLSFYSPETFGFLAVYGIPHLVFSRGFLLWGLLKIAADDDLRSGAQAGVLWVIMAFFQPLNVGAAWMITGSYGFCLVVRDWVKKHQSAREERYFSRKQLHRWFLAWGITLPVVLYYGLINRDSMFSGWQAQNMVLTPRVADYLLAYGLLLPFAAAYLIRRAYHGFSRPEWLLIAWMVALPVMINFPINTQRRLADGAWAALVALAAMALDGVDRSPGRFLRWSWLLAFPAAAVLLMGGAINALAPAEPVFIPEEEAEAYLYLKQVSGKEARVLSSLETGNALPAWAPVYVVLGHPVETLEFQETNQWVEAFYRGELNAEEMSGLMHDYSIDYVFWGPAEKTLSKGAELNHSCLEWVYGNQVQIFRVNCTK
jgi:hypothetical protein